MIVIPFFREEEAPHRGVLRLVAEGNGIVYILCQIQIVSMLTMICFRKLPFDHIRGFMLVPKLVLFIILLLDFKQLFRRNWWPTAWRTALIVLFI